MKLRIFYAILVCGVAIMSCQKIEVPKEIKSFYTNSIDGVSYIDSLIYEVEKMDGENFEIKLSFEGGSGFENLKIVNTGLNEQLSYHAAKDVSEIFTVNSPEKGALKGSLLISGQMNYSQYYRGAASNINKYLFQFYLVDQMGITRSINIKFIKP